MPNNKKDLLREQIDNVLTNKDKLLSGVYAKSLEQLIEDLKIYQYELEFQNDELRRIQNQLQKTVDEFEELFQEAPLGYIIMDENFQVIRFNENAKTNFIKELYHGKQSDLRKFIKVEDQDRFHLFCKRILKDYRRDEIEIKLKAKNPLYVNITANVKRVEGKIFFRLALYDITRRKVTEKLNRMQQQELSAITENMSEVIAVSDLSGNITYISPSCSLLGYQQEDFFGSTIFDHVHPEDINAVKESHARAFATQKSDMIRFRYKIKSGDYIWVETSGSFIFNEEGEIAKTLFVMRDISHLIEHERMTQEIELNKKNLQFKQKFLASLSHEIRTPLSGIVGIAELLEKTNLDDTQKDFVNTLVNSSENLREIIDQVLDFSKIEAGKVKLNKTVFSPASILNYAKETFALICKKNIVFESATDTPLPNAIFADQKRIMQVMNNLLVNAIKFTEEGKITVRYSDEKLDDGKTIKVKIGVSDTGIGIDPKLQKQIFTPFSQVDEIDTEKYHGIGLGLTICREIVTLHGGEIGVISKIGEGSHFWFTFVAEVPESRSFLSSQKGSLQEKVLTQSLKILLAEDKPVTQKVVKLQLTAMGHNVTLAPNGKRVLEIFNPGQFDLILMDIQMPEMDGITATKIIREKYDNIPPIIGLSANAFEGDKEKYMAQGLDDYLTKPFRSADFKKLVNKLFQ
jgi:PAS domain S-box-containing protein